MSVIVYNNQIHIIGYIDDSLASNFSEKIEIAASYPAETIELHISSPGGSMHSTEQMLDKMTIADKTIISYIHNAELYGGEKGVCSAASVLVSKTDYKIIDYNAIFMVHHASVNGVVQENEDDIIYWIEKTGMDYDIINNLFKTETKMTSDVAKALGFVDAIRQGTYSLPTNECMIY